jgi:hypothetical protein
MASSRAKLWARYRSASHGRAIVSAGSLPQTTKTMETKRSIWKGVKKSEKLSLVTLALCIVALAAIILLRPF